MKIGMNLLLWTDHVTEAHDACSTRSRGRLRRGRDPDLRHDRPEALRAAGQAAQEPGAGGDGRHRDGAAIPTRSRRSRRSATRRSTYLDRVLECGSSSAARSSAARCTRPSASSRAPGRPRTSSSTASRPSAQAAEKAQARGIRLAVEYLNRFENYFLTTAAQTVRFVRAVDHPSCKMMYDSFHAHIEEKDQAKAIASCAAETIHVHISENDRGTPGTGQVNWDSFFGGLKKSRLRRLPDDRGVRPRPAGARRRDRVWRPLFPDASASAARASPSSRRTSGECVDFREPEPRSLPLEQGVLAEGSEPMRNEIVGLERRARAVGSARSVTPPGECASVAERSRDHGDDRVRLGIRRKAEEAFFDRAGVPNDREFNWAVLNETDGHIGFIGLHGDPLANRSATGGILIGERSAWGRGYATDAVQSPHPGSPSTSSGLHRDRRPYHQPGHETRLREVRIPAAKAPPGRGSGETADWHDMTIFGILRERLASRRTTRLT